jgi:hypothetical protein
MYSNGGADSFTREAKREKEAEKRLFFLWRRSRRGKNGEEKKV